MADGTDRTSLVATFTLGGVYAYALVTTRTQVSGVTANDFTNPVNYGISLRDLGSTYPVLYWTGTVRFIRAGTDILSFSFPKQTEDEDATINAIDHTVAIIEVAYGTELNALVPTFTLSPEATATVGTVAQTSGITANDFTNGVT